MAFTDPGAEVPAGLRTSEFVLRPIVADDAEADYAAVMETREPLRLWEQSSWPADDFTVEDNRADLVVLEERHAAHRAFTFTVVEPQDDGGSAGDSAGSITGSAATGAGTGAGTVAPPAALGCVYIFPTDASFLAKSMVTPVGDAVWDDVDAVVYFWARLSRMETGMDERLLAALRTWFAQEWKLATTVYVTNEQFLQQRALLDSTDLTVRFELVEPGKPGTYLVYG